MVYTRVFSNSGRPKLVFAVKDLDSLIESIISLESVPISSPSGTSSISSNAPSVMGYLYTGATTTYSKTTIIIDL